MPDFQPNPPAGKRGPRQAVVLTAIIVAMLLAAAAWAVWRSR
ncbi:MAG TPA: hypothetical protein VGP80_15105 [Gemmatimonadales bacterium]|jgi:hypothetical protein|nr:hypothetical protein [Gemmatimonadales bacterium]